MKVIALVPGTTDVHLGERPEPLIMTPEDIKIRILQVGICGTDREEAAGGRARAPEGQTELVIGHEMLGQVVEVGREVTRVRAGDYAVFTVRRGCGQCLPCAINRSDMCRTGNYLERGIWGLDGYQAELVVDKEQYVVRVPPELKNEGVLCEPLSIVEKAIDESMRLQAARLPDAATAPDWFYGRHCLIAGLGPVGLLAALVLRLRGAEVYGLDVVDSQTARPRWLAAIGGRYVDGRQIHLDKVNKMLEPMDFIFEAAGVSSLAFNLLDALAPNGVYVLTGIPGDDCCIQIAGGELLRQLVLDNQVMLGSVNAARDHFQMAVNDLAHARLQWGEHVAQLITHRYPYSDFTGPLTHHEPDEIKAVLEWAV